MLIPYLRIACQLSNFSSYLVAFSFYISYTVMAISSAAVLRRTGYKKGMALGLLIMAIGAALFIPAALTRSYQSFLTGLFIQGTGLAILQTASNPYVTILGPRESAAKRISIMGICNGIAGVIAPLIIGSVTLQDADAIRERVAHLPQAQKIALLDTLAHRVITPYIIIALALALLSTWVFFSGLPGLDTEPETDGATTTTFTLSGMLLGLANSLVWPSIWPLGINGLGRFTPIGSSFLIVAIGGGALLPLLYGWLADLSSPQHAYWLVIPCYACIGWYALQGHKAGLR